MRAIHSSRLELAGIDCAKVEMHPPGGKYPELPRDLGTDFEAARSDRRADGCLNILRLAAVFGGHPAYGRGGNGCGRASPARVNSRHNPLNRIGKQNRDTIGSLHPNRQARLILDERIAAVTARRSTLVDDNCRRVDLMESGYGRRRNSLAIPEFILHEPRMKVLRHLSRDCPRPAVAMDRIMLQRRSPSWTGSIPCRKPDVPGSA